MSKQNFAILLLTVFIIEFAVMVMFAPLLSNLSPFAAGTIDSCLLVLMFAPPLWIVCSQLCGVRQAVTGGQFLHPGRLALFCKLLCAVCAIEFMVMSLILTLLPSLQGNQLAFLDASLTALIVLPFARGLFRRFGDRIHSPSLADLLSSPVIIYSAILYMVFLADAGQEALQPYLTPQGFEDYALLVDSSLTTVLIAPFIWLIVGKPLIKAAKEEKFRTKTILDEVVDAVITVDVQGLISSMNPTAEKIFGYKFKELQGRPILKLFDGMQPDIQQTLIDPSYNQPGQEGRMFRERICQHRNGGNLFMDISVNSVWQHGRKESLMILHDITQHKETERALRERDERFQQIFEQADDAIAFFRPHTSRFIDVNTPFAKLFGYSKTEIMKQKLEHLIGPRDLPQVNLAIRRTAKGFSESLQNFIGLHCSGAQINLSMRSKLMTIDNIDIIFCSFRDITDRIRLENEAKEIQAKLIQTNKMTSLGLMVSGVAHEINNPSNFILANSRMLANTWDDTRKILYEYYQEHGDFCLGGMPFPELDEHFPQLLSGIHEGAVRIDKIVRNLKNFYRPVHTRDENVNLNQVVISAASLLQHELVRFTKNFDMNLAENLPVIKGSGQQLGQVVINLLMNACQALPNKNHGVWVQTSYNPETTFVTLSVRDEGRGMSPEDSQKIMEPFFTTKLDAGGTGLGLAISRSIVTEHAGALEFDSTPGKGTIFTVRLPAFLPGAKDRI